MTLIERLRKRGREGGDYFSYDDRLAFMEAADMIEGLANTISAKIQIEGQQNRTSSQPTEITNPAITAHGIAPGASEKPPQHTHSSQYDIALASCPACHPRATKAHPMDGWVDEPEGGWPDAPKKAYKAKPQNLDDLVDKNATPEEIDAIMDALGQEKEK